MIQKKKEEILPVIIAGIIRFLCLVYDLKFGNAKRFLPAACAYSAAMPVLFYSVVQNGFFAPINVKFGTGERTCSPHSRAKFHVYRGKNVGIQPPNCQNFEFWPEICISGATRAQYFYEILSVCTHL